MADQAKLEKSCQGVAPLISIVIPTFNRSQLLVDAVGSCLAQPWRDVEVIVIDDGSTDETEWVVSELLGASWPEDQIRYVRQPNQGASAARNHGLRLARGDYVQFLDSDDLLHPMKIAKQVAALELAQNSEAVCCHCYGTTGTVAEDGTWASSRRIGVSETNPADLVRALCSRLTHGMSTCAPLWRRQFLQSRAGWREDISLGDDLEYHIRLLVDARRVCVIEEALFFVREHSGPRLGTGQMSASALASLLCARRAIFDSVNGAGLWDTQVQRAFLSAMRTIYANALELGDKKTILDLENWLWSLSTSPKRVAGLQLLILTRRFLGRHFLLRAHGMISAVRSWTALF